MATEKIVALLIDSKEYELSGDWQWDLHTNAVYCSNVMHAFPPFLEGTKGIIHPDDKAFVLDKLVPDSSPISFLQFRIITTYGEVKLLTGRLLQLSEVEPVHDGSEALVQPVRTEYGLSKLTQKLQWQARAATHAERMTETGYWYLNTSTGEMFYSDGVYRLYGLPAQSLNAHLHTFSSFIHPDERTLLEDALARSIQLQLPLHVEYHIQLPNGVEKKLRQTTAWEFNDKGALMLYGSIADITSDTVAEQKMDITEANLSLKNRLLQQNEQITGMAYWYINLLTRKVEFSDNMYRLHGVKPRSMPPGLNIFLNYVHPEDREVLNEVSKKIIRSHEPPDIDFRVVRPDGTIRYMRQRGKMVVYNEGEMVMIVSLQDVTKEKITERKLAEWKEAVLVKSFVQHTVETTAGVGSWVWDVETGNISFSDSLYNLLGYKSSATQLTYNSFLRFIHADDRKAVNDAIEQLLQEKTDSRLSFRLIRLGEERFVNANFRMVTNSVRELFIATLQDVTANHKLQQELAKQIQLAESISSNIRDAVYITDENNNILHWNKAAESWFGIKKDEALYANFFELLPHLKEETTLSQFNNALKGQPVLLSATKSAMSKRHYDLLMMPLRNADGSVNGIFHLLHDVTSEREMQQRLTERLNFIERLLEASVDHILVLDRHMNYLYCNQKAAEAMGMAKEELLGKNVLEIFPASFSNPSYEYFRKAMRGETIHIPAIEGGLDEHYGQVFLIPIKDGDVVSAILWIRQDLSGELKFQRQLKKADDILNTIDAAFMELNSEFQFKYINPTAESYFGKPKEELLDKVIWEVLPQLVHTSGYGAVLKAVEENTKTETEYYSDVLHKWIYLSAMPTSDGVVILIYDRHAIKEAQQHLQDEHRRLLEAQAIGKIGSFEWEAGKEEVLWSDEMYRINGMEPQRVTITVNDTHSLAHAEDLPKLLELKQKAISQPGIYEFEHRIVLPGGVTKWVRHRFESLADGEGKAVRVHGTLQDITTQKKAEEEIAKNLAILQQAEDIAAIGSWEYQIATGRLTWSNGMYRIFGSSINSALEPEVYLIAAVEEDRSVAKRIVKNLRKNHEPFEETLRIKRTDGERILKVKATVVKDDAGAVQKIVGVDWDITEMKKAEEELAQSRHWLLQTAEASPDSIVVYNFATKQPVYLNNCLANWSGIDTAELVQMGIEGRLQLIYPDDRLRLLQFNELVAATPDNQVQKIEYRLRRKDGTELWLRNRSKVFLRNKDGKATHLLSILQDVTEEKRNEASLAELNKALQQKAHELQLKNDEVTNFAFIASHDLKEPIRKIQTFSNWLMEQEADGLSIRGKEFTYKISGAVRRLDKLIEDITTLTRLQAIKPSVDGVLLNDVLRTAKEDLKEAIEETGAVIESKSLPVINGDRGQLVHLFRNLLSNAIKFQEADVMPVIEIFCQEVNNAPGLPQRRYLRLSFTDNGIGFEPQYSEKIFRVFQRLHGPADYPGTGIGLSICKKIMENHQGTIEAQSNLGQGSVFSCYFPC